MFGCCPRHQVRMLVPERGEPTTKIGLLIGVAADESISYSWRNTGLRPFILPKNFFDREFMLGTRLRTIWSITVRLNAQE